MKSVLKTALFLSLALVVFTGIIVASFSGLFPQYLPKQAGIICLCAAACTGGAWLRRLRKESDEIVRGKIRRAQLEFLSECFSRKLSRMQVVGLVMEKKDALSEEIQHAVGFRGKRKAAELDMLIESGWKDIAAVFSSGGTDFFSESEETAGRYEDLSVILPEKAEDILPAAGPAERDGNEPEQLEELEEVLEGEPVDELEELEPVGELEPLEDADEGQTEERTDGAAADTPESVKKSADGGDAASGKETGGSERQHCSDSQSADDLSDDSDELPELEAAEDEDDLYDFASAPFFEPGRKYSLLKSVLLNDDADKNIQIMKSINESYADRKSVMPDSEVLEFSDPDVAQDEMPDMSIADMFTVFTPYQPDAAAVFSAAQSGTDNTAVPGGTGKETTDKMDADAEDMELLPEGGRKPFMLIPLGAGFGQAVDLTYDAVIEGADGVFHIADDLDTGDMPVDSDFKNLVESVLK